MLVRYTISCNPLDDKARLPDDILLATLVMPFFYSVILRVHWRTLLATVVIIIGALLTGGLIEKLYLSLQYVAIFIPLMLVVLHEHQRQTMAQFYIALKQQALIQENERLAEDVHAQEMRHMIANVAHDLKTVRFLLIRSLELFRL